MKKTEGFTIVEMLVYMGLLTGFLVVLTQIFLSSLDVQLASERTSSVAQDGRYILSRLEYDVARAQSIDVPVALGGQAGSLQLTIAGIPHTYLVDNGNLTLTNAFGTNAVNSVGSRISGFTVRRLGNVNGKQSARVSFILTSMTEGPTGPEVRTYETTIGVR